MTETPPPSLPRRLILLTGMSGAGLSSALKAFEDIGYEAVDNLRLGLIAALLDDHELQDRHLAVAIDTRNANFAVDEVLRASRELGGRHGVEVSLLFLDCADDQLQQRFTETRRRHPLATDRPVTDGIARERTMLWPLKSNADQVIDTTALSINDLRRFVAGSYRFDHDLGLTLFVTSFSYRQGLPREADLVFDGRFLANPHWDPSLRPLSGRDPEIAAFIRADPGYAPFVAHIGDLLLPLLPRYQQEGKAYLTVAFGCTGGRHRSVLLAEDMATILASHGYVTGLGHRDIDRGSKL